MEDTTATAVTASIVDAPSHVAKHAGITFAGSMAANVLGYVFYTLTSRSLGVDAYGTFSSLVAVVLILQAPALIAQMVVAKLASDFARQPERLAGLVRSVDRITFTIAGSGAAALIAASVPLAKFLHVSDPLLVTFAGLSVFGALSLPFLRGVLQGTSRFVPFTLSGIVENLAKSVFTPLLGVIVGIRGAVAGMAIGYGVAVTYTFFAALPHRRGSAYPFSLRTVLRASVSIAFAVFALNVLLLYDVVLAKRYLDSHTAGLYGAAALSGRALYALTAFVPIVLLPQAVDRMARGARTRNLYLQAIGLGAALGLAAIGFFALLPRFVVTTVAGRSFADAAPLLILYVYAMAMLSLANITVTYNIARGRMSFVIPLACVAAAEITSVTLRHGAPSDLLQTIAVGHTLAFFASILSLGSSGRGAPATAQRSTEL